MKSVGINLKSYSEFSSVNFYMERDKIVISRLYFTVTRFSNRATNKAYVIRSRKLPRKAFECAVYIICIVTKNKLIKDNNNNQELHLLYLYVFMSVVNINLHFHY